MLQFSSLTNKSGLVRRASLAITALALASSAVLPVWAATANLGATTVSSPKPAAKISFTFDDGLKSAIIHAAPTLQKHGLVGTDYVITKCVGMTTAPNTCHANTDAVYMNWGQVKKLQSTYGWEIGSHTATHPYLATKDASDGQPKVLTPAQVKTELVDSKADLAAHGINATAFSTPYGDYNNDVLAQIAKYYASHRGFADEGFNGWPNNDYLLYDFRVQAGVSVAQVKQRIDQAIANHQWLILTMHDIKDAPSSDPDDYQYGTRQLDQIAAYVAQKQQAGLIQSVRVSQGLVTSDTNLLPNATFDDGLADGWTTDNPQAVTVDRDDNGSYPSPANSIKITANNRAARLYSPRVIVDPYTTYMLKNFLNVKHLTSGEVEFYIDEYDINGNWISGQYKKAEPSSFVEDINMAYTPSSPRVATADIQVTVTAGSGITAYLDNFQWFPLNDTSVNRPNLITNGDFNDGLADGWTTDDPTNVTTDNTSHGSPANPANSIHGQAIDRDTHLFSPAIKVSNSHNYTLSTWVNVADRQSGEVGFYIDEYNLAGNWISGQYITGFRHNGSGNVRFSYTPTSANVSTASLQIIFQGNSAINAYVDDVHWYTD